MTLKFANIFNEVQAIDEPNRFFSPSLQDHILRNKILNIVHTIVDVKQFLEDMTYTFDVIYLNNPESQIIKHLERTAKSDFVLLYVKDGKVVRNDIVSNNSPSEEETTKTTGKIKQTKQSKKSIT